MSDNKESKQNAANQAGKAKQVAIPHVPHLLDFHDLRRPECLSFWVTMALCFGLGFIPRSRTELDT